MKRWKVVLILAKWIVACVVGAAYAQGELGPNVPMLGKAGFSVMGTATPEVALPATFTFNPAALGAASTAYQVKYGGELDLGRYTFREGPDITLDIENFFFPVKGGLIRLSRYGVRSNTQEAKAMPGLDAKLQDGEAFEISWGQRITPQLHVGLAIVPKDKVETVLSSGGFVLAQGDAKSEFEWRVGIHYKPSEMLSAGVVYAWEKDSSKIVLSPLLTGMPDAVEMSGKYRNIITIAGVAFQPLKGTVLLGNLENYRLAGPSIDERTNIFFYGIQQFFTKSGSYITIGSSQRGFFVSGNYTLNKFSLGFSYSPRANRRLEEYLGRSKGGYMWVALNF